MDFYHEWNKDKDNPSYIVKYLTKTEESREVLRHGTESDVKFACDLLRSICMETYLHALQLIATDRLPSTDEIPQCGTLDKAICEVPQALAFAPEGLICSELGLRIGAENHGDAPRKSGEGNGKLADSMDIAIRSKLLTGAKGEKKYGYRLSSLGHYLLRYQDLSEKKDIVARLLIREYLLQRLFSQAMEGYTSYDDAVSSLKSIITRKRRRQNVRKIALLIDSELKEGRHYFQNIDWKLKDTK